MNISIDQTNKNYRVGFIGAGNMASALAEGMIIKGTPSDLIMLSDINHEVLDSLSQRLRVKSTQDNKELIINSDIIVIAVKPQVLRQVLEPLAETLQEHPRLLISIAAGVSIDSLTTWTCTNESASPLAIIRCMPNTPALVNLGVSGLYASPLVSLEQKQQAESILSSVGLVAWLDKESQIDAVTALSGSGPAYYFLMIEAMTEAGQALGLSKEIATTLSLQTALGASTMAKESEYDVAELRKRVTSPKGTTEAAIHYFQKNKFESIIASAMHAAYDRSIALSKD